ncbi:hypothetical protein MNV49_001076 [Pseudohyphozyma bogoriensis]|nr:hypothetical protein MNV49_001076 [Pseudohyphozyma bogoriensis]
MRSDSSPSDTSPESTSTHPTTPSSSASPEDHAASEDQPPNSLTRTEDAPPRKRKCLKREDGKPFKRKGRVVGVLRERYAAIESSLDLAPSSNGARLGVNQLSAALAYHLFDCAKGVINATNSPPVIDLTATQRKFQSTIYTHSDPRQEVILASLIALGSRRTFHSAVAGPYSLTTAKNLTDLANLDIGTYREATCRKLAQRAVDLAISSDLLSDTSPEALEAASILRVTLFAVNPRHPFGAELAVHLHRTHQQKESTPSFTCTPLDKLGLSVAEYDSYISVLRRKPPTISVTELALLYGWRREQVQGALEILRHCEITPDKNVQHAGRTVAIFTLRGVSHIQRQGE